MTYRKLTDDEIALLEDNNCRADDWESVNVSDDFNPAYLRDVAFYGEVNLGDFDRNIEISPGFLKHSGIYRATLRNVTVGDNCLIENVNNYINNYTIGDNCYISNVATIETIEGTTYGQGNIISAGSPSGESNLMLFTRLNSQLAALMVKYSHDKELHTTLRKLIKDDVDAQQPERGTIGEGAKIVNTVEITNSILGDYCEVNGACRLSDVTVMGTADASVFIGTGVICENSVIGDGASLLNHAIVQDCLIGEECKISNGFTAAESVIFANSCLSKGEAANAFCLPFTTSHHKNSRLTGYVTGLYNIGDNDFGQCPALRLLPYSSLIRQGNNTFLAPGAYITTAAHYRNIRQWARRCMQIKSASGSIVNTAWLSPFTVNQIAKARQTLENLHEISGKDAPYYSFNGLTIRHDDLLKGIQNYDMAIHIYMGTMFKNIYKYDPELDETTGNAGQGEWDNLAGLLLPSSEERQITEDIKDGSLESIDAILRRFDEMNAEYSDFQRVWSCQFTLNYYQLTSLHPADISIIHDDFLKARQAWTNEIRQDAEREYQENKINRETLEALSAQLDRETDNEN